MRHPTNIKAVSTSGKISGFTDSIDQNQTAQILLVILSLETEHDMS